jgi:tRNA pseudouridine55 synthase
MESGRGGALLVDKPAGKTSHDLVAAIRRERGGKVGHAGTLDPFATGLLIILLGQATRLQRYLLELPKTYVATARLGWRSSTGDPDGELTETGRIPEVLALPTGEVEQQVPMTSAVKVGGERLYKKAHRGERVETPSRTVMVHRADLIESGEGAATFEIECSSGTYIRTLIETLEDAYCESLRRTATGPFTVPDDEPVEIDIETLTSFLPGRVLTDEELDRVSHGRPIDRARVADPPWGDLKGVGSTQGGSAARPQPIRLTHNTLVVAIAHARDGELQPEVVLA